MTRTSDHPLSPEAFAEQLRSEGNARYHHEHPFHRRMHEGRLSPQELQGWVLNRYYYQTRIPVKDALILSKSDDPAFRRMWIHRIQDHDGTAEREGGLALWRKLGEAVGVENEEITSYRSVLPGVRAACDEYVTFVRDASLVEAVASSLTELFAPDLMIRRLAAWEHHYPWVDRTALEYFRCRITRAAADSDEALAFVLSHATTTEAQNNCIRALIRKTEILWRLLDHVSEAFTKETYDTGEPPRFGFSRQAPDRSTIV